MASKRHRRTRCLHPAEHQVTRHASLADRLRLVARLREARPRLAPVVGARGGPEEFARLGETQQRPFGVVRPVGGKAEFAARAQHAREARDVRRVDEAPLPVAPLRPGIGIKQIDPADRVLRQPVEQVDRVGVMQPDIFISFPMLK